MTGKVKSPKCPICNKRLSSLCYRNKNNSSAIRIDNKYYCPSDRKVFSILISEVEIE